MPQKNLEALAASSEKGVGGTKLRGRTKKMKKRTRGRSRESP